MVESIDAKPRLSASAARNSCKRAYVIADNKLALLSSWDPGLLKAEMEVLIAEEVEIEVTGFSTAEVDLMFDDQIGGDPDELQPEDITEVIVSRLGDLWQLGSHRLLCGDALAAEAYTGLMDPARRTPTIDHAAGPPRSR